jgi:hypothetical protein
MAFDEGKHMAVELRKFVTLCFVLACAALIPRLGHAQENETFDISADNLLVVLRESKGDNKQDESLKPVGKVRGTTTNGREIELEMSWFQYLGDMHIRLVFDGRQRMQSASPDDLARLKLSADEALQLAIANLRRVYGSAEVQPWTGSMMQVQSGAPDLNSSYFLDRELWRRLQAPHPDGLVVAVPRRGGLVYAPASDETAVANLRFSAAALYAGGPGARLSSALYLFKNDQWSVFQPAQSHPD